MSEECLVRHCAPTLAGIKTASLFTYPYESRDQLLESVRRLNNRLRGKGVRVLPLRYSGKRALIYIYRPNKLSADLANETAAKILEGCGYHTESCEKCVVKLIRKLRMEPDFPHEIGLFLGYPPEDVCGFIEKGPDCSKCTGCWKVYGDEVSAQKKFAQIKKCTEIYCAQFAKGIDIEQLTVAG